MLYIWEEFGPSDDFSAVVVGPEPGQTTLRWFHVPSGVSGEMDVSRTNRIYCNAHSHLGIVGSDHGLVAMPCELLAQELFRYAPPAHELREEDIPY